MTDSVTVITTSPCGDRVRFLGSFRSATMNFDSTVTEADFKRPLIDPQEASLMRDACGEPDLRVDGLSNSLVGWLARLFSRRPR
jgi:hypothetical protein